MLFLEADFQSAADTYEIISTQCLHKFEEDVDKYGMELANVNELPLASGIDMRTGQMFCSNASVFMIELSKIACFLVLVNLSLKLCS